MPLIKGGRIVADPYVRVDDDAPVADDVPVIVPAARFLADAAERARRAAPSACVAQRRTVESSPRARPARAGRAGVSEVQATAAPTPGPLLRERYGFRGEMRAIGEVLRDQFCS